MPPEMCHEIPLTHPSSVLPMPKDLCFAVLAEHLLVLLLYQPEPVFSPDKWVY